MFMMTGGSDEKKLQIDRTSDSTLCGSECCVSYNLIKQRELFSLSDDAVHNWMNLVTQQISTERQHKRVKDLVTCG